MSLVYVIEDDPMMADVIALAARSTVIFDADGKEVHPNVRVFNDAVEPISEMETKLPDVILLDILLSGPDGFTFLNELLSYQDTAKIPVAIITSLDLSNRKLDHYGVFQILDKGKMTPEDIRDAVLMGLEQNKISQPVAEEDGPTTDATNPTAKEDAPAAEENVLKVRSQDGN